MAVTLDDVSSYVNRLEAFRANSCFGKWTGEDIYSVYSYGEHFPMYVYDASVDRWYGNTDKWSRTTSRHQSKCRPRETIHWYNTETMKDIAYGGIAYAVAERMSDREVQRSPDRL